MYNIQIKFRYYILTKNNLWYRGRKKIGMIDKIKSNDAIINNFKKRLQLYLLGSNLQCYMKINHNIQLFIYFFFL